LPRGRIAAYDGHQRDDDRHKQTRIDPTMALAPANSASTDPVTGAEDEGVHAPGLQVFVFALFFIFGGITSLNDVIIPKLKELFTLNYTQAMLIQFCFFFAYAVIGIPGAILIKRTGYMRGAVIGLLTMMVGCLLFIPSAQTATYGLFLFALFVLATGVVMVQIVSNPLISLLGPAHTASSRLTFAQGFNSIGTTIFPFVGAVLILGGSAQSFWDVSRVVDPACAGTANAPEMSTVNRIAESQMISHTYLGLAMALLVIAGAVWLFRNRLKGERHEVTSLTASFDLLRRPRFAFGALCIFLYVGAEVAIGSTMVNYLKSDHALCLTGQSAGKQLLFYWGGAMIGRFIGSAVLRAINPGKVLAGVAIGAILLVLVSISTHGATAANTLLAVGLMNSIMFPTIFTLACEKLGDRAADGSGIINVAICGGAIVPVLTGMLADTLSLSLALLLPAACYLVIASYGMYARKPAA
jgi:FHS family L-fucose permease-like MFS transporter